MTAVRANPPKVPDAPVLIVAPQSFFTPVGTPINVLQMCRALTDAGYTVEVLSLPYGEPVTMPGLAHHTVARLPGLKRIPVGFSASKLAYDAILAITLVWRLTTRRYASVHALEESAYFAIPLARLFRLPAIMDLDSDLPGLLSESGSAIAAGLAPMARALRRFALNRSSAAITVASAISRMVAEESPGTPVFEIRDIPLEGATRPPDPVDVKTLKDSYGLTGHRVIAYTGNLDKRQGVSLLIEAFARVHRDAPDTRLLLVGGETAQIAAMRQTARDHGIADVVILAGRKPPETMAEHMGLADILASPRLEPLITPLKIYSYMASGRPIVATDYPTHTDVLGPDSAFLVEATAEGLAKGLRSALADPDLARQKGAAARTLVDQHFTFDRFRQQVLAVYASVLPQTGNSSGAAAPPRSRSQATQQEEPHA